MMSKKDERKERVIHTRVSETLDQELRDRAMGLGVSVSNLVRNVLLNTFGLVESVVADSASVARSVKGQPSHGPPDVNDATGAQRRSGPPGGVATAPAESPIIGWQELVLSLNAVCVTCNAILPKGSDAAIAVTTSSGPRPISCLSCVEALKRSAEPSEPELSEPEPSEPESSEPQSSKTTA